MASVHKLIIELENEGQIELLIELDNSDEFLEEFKNNLQNWEFVKVGSVLVRSMSVRKVSLYPEL